MSQENEKGPGEETGIVIDYDHIDVAGIMETIKKKIAARPQPASEEALLEARGPASPFLPEFEGETGGEFGGRRQRVKRLLLKLMRPFAPLIKLMILPVYEEQRQLLLHLHNTNLRLDRIDETPRRVREYSRLLHNLSHNIVVELTKLKIEEEMLKTRIRVLEKDFENLQKRERALEEDFFK